MFDKNPSVTIPTLPAPIPGKVPVPRPSFASFPRVNTAALPGTAGTTSQPTPRHEEHMKKPTDQNTPSNETVQHDLESLLPQGTAQETAQKASAAPSAPTQTQQATEKVVTNLELAALRVQTSQLNPNATQAAPPPDVTVSEMRLTMRDALIMLDRDIPRAIDVITTKHTAYPYGYLKDGNAFGSFLQSPSLIALLRSAKAAQLESLPLPKKLPELAVPRTAYILSSIAEQLSAKGCRIDPQPQDFIAGETKTQTAYRTNLLIEDYLTALAPDDTLKQLMADMA